MFDWLGGIVDTVSGWFGTDLGPAIIKTAGSFIFGGTGEGQQGSPRQRRSPVQTGGIGQTSRPGGPSTPSASSAVEVLHDKWRGRMRVFATLEAISNTGGPRITERAKRRL